MIIVMMVIVTVVVMIHMLLLLPTYPVDAVNLRIFRSLLNRLGSEHRGTR